MRASTRRRAPGTAAILARMRLAGLLVALTLAVPCVAPAQAPPGAALHLSDPRHVRALYLDLLGRTPDGDELDLAQASQPAVVAAHLVDTQEFWEHWLEDELHYFLLVDNARPADAEGEGSLPFLLHEGKQVAITDAVGMIVTGQAFHRANPGNDTFASVVLEQLLGINVQRDRALLAAGRRMYDGERVTLFGEEGDSQSDLVAIVMRQPGFLPRLVARQHARIVGREAGKADVIAGAARLAARPADFPALVRDWVLSPAYAARLATLRPKTDAQFIRGLFVDLTGSRPTREEVQRLRGALSVMADAAPLRAVIARALIEDRAFALPQRGRVEPEAFVEQTFRRYLGRDPLPEERADFVLVFRQEGCEPATLVQAVVTHWEYQYY